MLSHLLPVAGALETWLLEYLMLFVQILAVIVFVGLIVLAILAFIEPGPLDRRSRDRQGRPPEQ